MDADAFPLDATESIDTDSDGVGDMMPMLMMMETLF